MNEKEVSLNNFLVFLLSKEFHISKKMAVRFASQFDSIDDVFLWKGKIHTMKKINGNPLFSSKLAKQIERALEAINPKLSIRQNYILSIGRVFSLRQLENIKKLTLDALNPNPFLIKALHHKSITEFIELIVIARVMRSIVTSFGFFFEELLIASGANSLDKGFDIYKIKDGITYFIQCKSGTYRRCIFLVVMVFLYCLHGKNLNT